MRTLPAWLATLALTGCNASFSDLAPAQVDRGTPVVIDSGPATDADKTADTGTKPTGSGVFAAGTWEGRTGHLGRGGADLFRRPDGTIELRFAANFETSPVPGPVVVLTRRASMGTSIDAAAGDLTLGALKDPKGTQTYVVTGGDGGRRFAWVFCEPFGVEIARAPLKDVK